MSQTILILDDYASVRLYLINFLTRKGYRCLGAADGAEALAKLAAHPVDLILLDLVMPGMSGNEFAWQLTTEPALARLPVLVITSERELAESLFAPSDRAVRILAKPVMPTVLLQCVHQLIGEAVLADVAPVTP